MEGLQSEDSASWNQTRCSIRGSNGSDYHNLSLLRLHGHKGSNLHLCRDGSHLCRLALSGRHDNSLLHRQNDSLSRSSGDDLRQVLLSVLLRRDHLIHTSSEINPIMIDEPHT
jgi:hypothetical protein